MAEEQEHKNSSSVGVLLDKIKDSLQNETSTGTLRLPLVLDAPFSNLSNANTGLVASRLPESAEQVIIFMLDKDWKYTGLDEYVGASYHIEKAADEAYASIRRVELDQQ